MSDRVVHPESGEDAEAVLRALLWRADAGAETMLPVLRHLLAAEDNQFFSDEIVARVRNMLADLADALVDGAGRDGGQGPFGIQQLIGALADDAVLLSHLHALAIEWQLTERLQARLGIDPVFAPLLATATASPDDGVRDRASAYLAAQSRWTLAQRRMQLPLRELPPDVLERVLAALSSCSERRAQQVEAELNASPQSGGRLASGEALAAELGRHGHSALDVSKAGVSLFLTALARASGQPRDSLILSIHETQIVRLALALRSSGLDRARTEEQLWVLYPGAALPAGLEDLSQDGAIAALAASGPSQERSL